MKCCFIGHRDCFGIEKSVYAMVQKLIAEGCSAFYSGGMGNFDKTCERVVKQLGGKIIYVPYHHARVKETDRVWYDEIILPFGKKAYEKQDIPLRNRWMVQQCDVCLCYVYRAGGAKKSLEYAIKENKRIIYIAG